MRLSQLALVADLARERGRLIAIIAEPRLGVTIAGTYQADDIVALVTPVVLGELRARVRRIEAELVALGVALG